MNRRELNNIHGPKVTEILGQAAFHGMVDTAREECPYLEDKSLDPTSIIRNDGRTQGWMACLRYLKSIGTAEEKKKEPEQTLRYADPSKPASEQNRKT